jgi:HEPN domain-containing protein
MSPDARADEVGQWLEKAREDLRAAQLLVDVDPPLTTAAAFHCQQAAEKALKGLLVRREVVFEKTHDIKAIAALLAGSDADLQPLTRRASRLTVYAWKYRYPGDVEEPFAGEIAEALATATEVVAAIEQRAMKTG